MDRALAQLQMLMVGTTRDRFVRMITQLGAVCPSRVKNDVSWDLVISTMYEDLGGYPEDILAEALKTWRRSQTFFPSIAEAIKEVTPLYDRRKALIDRLGILLRVAENPAPNGEASLEWYVSIMGGKK